MDLDAVVDHMGDAELRAVHRLVGAFTAEPDIAARDTRPAIEIVVVEPLRGAFLHPGTAFGDHPGPAAEPVHEPGQHLESVVAGRGSHGFLRATREEDGIARTVAVGARAYLVETMAETGVDLILGVRRDPVFGLVVVAGLGGTAAEALGDIAVRGLPLHPAAATALLDDLRCAPLLNGRRGGPVLDRDEFARAVVAIGDHLAAHPEIGELEINPLRLTPDGLIALDAVITGSDARPANPEDEQR